MMSARRFSSIATEFAIVVIAIVMPITARAQQQTLAPSQVAPPVIPAAPTAPTRILLPRVEAGATIPPGAKQLSFVLTEFRIEGEFEELAAERHGLEAQLIGKKISVAQVFEFATALQALYVRAGYPLVRVVVTPQELGEKAVVAIRVIDGFIERIDAGALPEQAQKPVLAVVSSLINQRHLTQKALERKLLLAGATPGVILNAVFSGGKEIGGSVLVLTGSYRAVSLSLYGDDAMPRAFGTGQFVATGSLNSIFGLGEQFTVSAAGLPDANFITNDPTRRYLSAIGMIPLGTDGWRLEAGYTNGVTTPRVDPSVSTRGQLTQEYVRLSYDAIKLRDAELNFSLRFDSTDQSLDSLAFDPAVPLSLDRLRVLRGSAEGLWQWRESGTSGTYGMTVSQGLNVLGARTAADASVLLPLSRAGADAVFTKLQGHASLTQSLPEELFTTLAFAGQTSFGRPLLIPEQFDITGAQMLSGYTTGSFVGDSAWVVRDEIGRSFGLPNIPVVVTPYLFGATGERLLAQPSVLEVASLHATNYGLGFRVNETRNGIVPVDVSWFAEGSRQQSGDPTQQGWRVFVGGLVRY